MSRTETVQPARVRGTLFTLRRRCSKPSCHWRQRVGPREPGDGLSRGRPDQDNDLVSVEVEEVRAGLERYNVARAEPDAGADAGVAVLRARLVQRRRPRWAPPGPLRSARRSPAAGPPPPTPWRSAGPGRALRDRRPAGGHRGRLVGPRRTGGRSRSAGPGAAVPALPGTTSTCAPSGCRGDDSVGPARPTEGPGPCRLTTCGARDPGRLRHFDVDSRRVPNRREGPGHTEGSLVPRRWQDWNGHLPGSADAGLSVIEGTDGREWGEVAAGA